MLNKACDSACVKLFKFAEDKIEVKSHGGEFVEDLNVALKKKILNMVFTKCRNQNYLFRKNENFL
jgi:hypothetical protein